MHGYYYLLISRNLRVSPEKPRTSKVKRNCLIKGEIKTENSPKWITNAKIS